MAWLVSGSASVKPEEALRLTPLVFANTHPKVVSKYPSDYQLDEFGIAAWRIEDAMLGIDGR